MRSYKELEVWQKGIALTIEIYEITKSFPPDEKYALTSQLRRCAVSVPSNIAEGWGRGGTKEYIRFLLVARGSLMELETQIIIALKLQYIDEQQYNALNEDLTSVAMMLNKLISRLTQKVRDRD